MAYYYTPYAVFQKELDRIDYKDVSPKKVSHRIIMLSDTLANLHILVTACIVLSTLDTERKVLG